MDYLADQVDAEGCVHGFSCSVRTTDWTVMALASAGIDPVSWPPGGTSPVTYLRENPNARTDEDTGREALWRARRILAVVAAGEDPRSFGGVDHVQELRLTFSGQFGRPDKVNDDMFATLALRAAGAPPDDAMLENAEQAIRDAQADNGGWSWCSIQREGVDCKISTDMTAAAIEALASLGADRSDPAVEQGLNYLEDSRISSGDGAGCLADQKGDNDPDPDSTPWVAMGLAALQIDARRSPWAPGDRSPVDCLVGYQNADGGFPPKPGSQSSPFTTTQTITALEGVPHGRAAWPVPRPDTTLAVDGTRQVGEPVDLAFPGADHASVRIEDHGFRTGADTSFTPERAGKLDLSWVVFDDAGRVATANGSIQVDEAPEEDTGDDGNDGNDGDDSGSSGGGDDDDAPAQDPDEDGGEDDASEPTPPSVQLRVGGQPERNVSHPFVVNATADDEPVVAYRVDWGDGSDTGWQETPRFNHTYDRVDDLTVTASARDAEGDVASTEATVRVVDAAPRVDLSGPAVVNRTENVTLHANATDPDGPTPTVRWLLPDENATGPELTTRFAEPGTHTVTAVAEDGAGNVARANRTLHAVNRPPTDVEVTPLTVDANTTVTLRPSASDPDGDELTYTWRVDGDTATAPTFRLRTGAPGNRTLGLNVTDPHDGWARVEVRLNVVADTSPESPSENGSVTERDDGTATTPPPEATTDDEPDANEDPDPPRVELPGTVRGTENLAILLEGDASQPGGNVTDVEVRLAGNHTLRAEPTLGGNQTDRTGANSTFEAILSAPPPGNYTLQARAAGTQGTWGPWANTTLVVEPDGDEPLEATGASSEEASLEVPGLTVPLTALLVAGAARSRRLRR